MALGLCTLTGVIGLVTSRVAISHDEIFPSWGYLAGELIWNASTLVLTFLAVVVVHHQVTAGRLGWRADPGAPLPPAYPRRAALAVAALAVLGVLTWGRLASDAEAFSTVERVAWGLAAAELLVRYPLTALAEETLFRGWLQPRLGTFAPVITAALWAGYHLQQVETIPSLLLVGLLLGYVRHRSRTIWPCVAIHYAGDALFFGLAYLL